MRVNVKEMVVFKAFTPQTLKIIEQVMLIWHKHGQVPTITSANDSKHKENSLHYKNMALDIRSFDIPKEKLPRIYDELKKSLGSLYDCVLENKPPHFHVEFDPR